MAVVCIIFGVSQQETCASIVILALAYQAKIVVERYAIRKLICGRV
jgi:hypothetical protein